MIGLFGGSYRVMPGSREIKNLASGAFILSWVLGILYVLLLFYNGKILSSISFQTPQSRDMGMQFLLSILISLWFLYKIIKYSHSVLDGEDAEVLVIGNVLALIIINFVSPISSMIRFSIYYYSYSYNSTAVWAYFSFYLVVVSIILMQAHLMFLKKKIEKSKKDREEVKQ